MKNRIKDLREDANMRQIDLADAVGIDQRTISNYETGKTYPDSFALIKIADYFNVSIDYLVGRTDYNVYASKEQNDLLKKIRSDVDKLHEAIHLFEEGTD